MPSHDMVRDITTLELKYTQGTMYDRGAMMCIHTRVKEDYD